MFAAKDTLLTRPSGGYQISRSLRFNSADSAYLNRTPAGAGNRRKWTFSAWVKRSSTGDQKIFSGGTGTGSTDYLQFYFASNDAIKVSTYVSDLINTTSVYRDYSAWYHVVLNIDTDNATATNRMQLYVNNTLITTANVTGDLGVNQTQAHYIGYNNYGTYFGGYMTEINFINDQALTPSSFGSTNADTGVWGPKKYSGSYGTNGFYLNFSDNSNTTAATLGKDYSGNGNNWTPTGFIVTAGADNDSLVDSPTSFGTDTGVGGTVRGNYCTLNPLNAGSTATLSNGNLNITGTIAATTSIAYATIGVSSGKWYWEVTPLTGDHMIGIGKDGGRFDWQTTSGYGYFGNNGQKYTNSAGTSYGATYANNDVIGIALDMDAGTLTYYKNGTSQGTAFSGLTGTWFPITQNPGSAVTEVFNFGQRPFAYTAPSGFKALCTQNLPTPTIGATTATQAGKFFNAVTYTGTGSSLGVTGVGFQPDWVWVKSRSAATDHGLYDAVRGVQKQLESNGTGAETTETTGITAFGSDGFTTGALAQLNTSSATYVAWNWKANGSGSSNTSGSITSTVSANTTSRFSVVTYTGNGVSGATVGHGLGVAPSMIIVKNRSGTTNWPVYHVSLGNTKALFLSLTNAADTDVYWNNTTPTSSVFTITPSGTSLNGSGATYVAYCFAPIAGYSAFGSYTGNGSADGPFVFCGFRPRFILGKDSGGTNNWFIFDSARDTYNVAGKILRPNLSDAELDSPPRVDLLSNGFKIRSAALPNDATTYIFMAFAESPFKYSLAR